GRPYVCQMRSVESRSFAASLVVSTVHIACRMVVRCEKSVRIFLEAGRRNQIQARGCAAGQGRNREYARAKCADRHRLCRSMEGPLMKQNSTSVAAVYDRRSVIVGRFCETPRRLTQTPYSQIPPAFFAICLSLLCLTSFA